MRITCPSCEAVYDVPAEKMAGRTLKCARCAHSWVPVAAAPPPEAEPPLPSPLVAPPPSPIPMTAPMRFAPPPPRRDWKLPAAWAGSIVILIAVCMAAVVARAEIMRAWPPSERVYVALGLR